LLSIWNNRGKNPKALTAALEAFAGELKDKYTVRQDPQLVENQRAVKASQQQMATTQKQSQQDEWSSMTPAERQSKVRLLINSGG
jgi:CTP:phosphocholine cytidylyltransferase-like protein